MLQTLLFALVACALALDNGVGMTPAMGYNTWDDFRCGGINADNVKKVADAFIKNGLDKVGYEYGEVRYTLTMYMLTMSMLKCLVLSRHRRLLG
jgi:hypothetical protein